MSQCPAGTREGIIDFTMIKDVGKQEVQISLLIDAKGVPTMRVMNADGISFELLLTV